METKDEEPDSRAMASTWHPFNVGLLCLQPLTFQCSESWVPNNGLQVKEDLKEWEEARPGV